MKKLFLIRHAKSSWDNPSLKDLERPLNNRGKKNIKLMGKILSEKNINPDLVISSPAKRAVTTARKICKFLNYPVEKIIIKDEIYEATVSELIGVIQETDKNENSLMLFGHNPGFTLLQNRLCKNNEIDNIPTCGVVCIELKSSWKKVNDEFASLKYFEYPKLYSKK